MSQPEDDTDNSDVGRPGKVERLLDAEELSGLGAELEARWLGDERERESLRDLAERFNRALLRSRMEANDIDAIDEEVDTVYRVLRDEGSVDSGSRTQLRRRLEREGLDLDALASDFVSRQAVHTYLTEVRGVEHEETTTDPVERDRRTIRQLLARTETVTEDKLERLRSDDRIELGEFRVSVGARVFCTDCGTQFDADELLRNRTCECE